MNKQLLLNIDVQPVFPVQSLENKIGYIGRINGSSVSESGAGIGMNYLDTSGSCGLNKNEFIDLLRTCFSKETISKYFPQDDFRIMTDPSQVNLYDQLKDKSVIVLYDIESERISGLIPIL